MNLKNIYRVFALYYVAISVLLLTGCNPTAGAMTYEVIYPSGYARDCYTDETEIPVEGTSYRLRWERAVDYEKTQDYDLQILNENGSVLYEYSGMGSDTMRGLRQADDKIWICVERWTAPHYRGYIEGWLRESNLLLIDMSDGQILFQDKAGENEFYITSNETRCYFYSAGKEEGEKLFGLLKTSAQNAEIYYRDTQNWAEKHTVYIFDYAKEPDIDTDKGVETRIKFYISEDQIKITWTSYESVGNGNWEYVEKKSYEIPITRFQSHRKCLYLLPKSVILCLMGMRLRTER